MKKPKFLSRFQTKKQKIKQLELLLEDKQRWLDDYEKTNANLQKEVNSLRQKETLRQIKQRDEESKRTDMFSADKWKVIYNSDGRLSQVFLNGKELYGCQRFDINFDAFDGQTPRFTYEGYGSIDIVTQDNYDGMIMF